MRKPLEIPELTAAEAEALDRLYRTTRVVRLRTRAQIVLLAGEQRLAAPAIARIVRENEETVRRWLSAGWRRGSRGCRTDRCRAGRRRSLTRTGSGCSRSSASVRAAWASPTRCGPCSAW